MIDSIAEMKMPKWLANVGKDDQSTAFPLKEILSDSLYYPSSGLDGDPVKYLSGNIYSFVYVDYGIGSDELETELSNPGFNGYHKILSRSITEKELTPNGWQPSPPSGHDGDPARYRNYMEKPFATWSVFKRDNGLDGEHGAERFSLLYLCADGVAAFQALYLSNNCSPLGIAIIQPGHGFGGNWTDFTDPTKSLAKSLFSNPAGKPQILLYGGIGKRDFYRKTCWPEYSNHVCFFDKKDGGSIGVWRDLGRGNRDYNERVIANRLIELFIEHNEELAYANLDANYRYSGWVRDFNIQTTGGENIALDLNIENDLFLMFVLAIAWSRPGHWENAAYFVAYLRCFDKSSPGYWSNTENIITEKNRRQLAASEITNIVINQNTRKKIFFRKDIYDSVGVLSNNWESIKGALDESEVFGDFVPFMFFMRDIEGLGANGRKILIKIPLILRELRCQNMYENISGSLCCVPDKRVIDAARELGINIENPYYKSTESISSLLGASPRIYELFGDLYDLPLFAYEDLKQYL